MATFDKMKFYPASVGFGIESTCDIYVYKDETNLIADLKVSGFFNAREPQLRKNALIYIVGSDDRELCFVETVSPIIVADLVQASSVSIPDGSITASKLANSACENEKIAANAIDETKLSSAVIDKLLSENNVSQSNMADDSIGTDQIISGNITNNLIADLAVTADKLDAATSAKLLGTNNVAQSNMATDSIGTDQVLNSAITVDKMAYIPVMEIGYTHATASGTATDSVIITGATAPEVDGDFVVANVYRADGANPTGQIQAAFTITNGVKVLWQVTPATGDKFKVLVLRPNAF